MQTRVEVDKNFNLLAAGIQGIACSGIGSHDFLSAALHCHGTGHQRADVESGHSYRQQAHRSEHREAAAHIVGDDVGHIALFVGKFAQGTAGGVGHRHDVLCRPLLAFLLLKHVLEQAEGDSGLGGGATLGNHNNAEFMSLDKLHQVVEVVLADVVAGKEHPGACGMLVGCKVIAKSLNHRLGT